MEEPPVTATNEDLKKALALLEREFVGNKLMHQIGTIARHSLKRIIELEKAVEPFAKAGVEDDGSERVEWRHHEDDELVENSDALIDLTAGDFRRARAAISD